MQILMLHLLRAIIGCEVIPFPRCNMRKDLKTFLVSLFIWSFIGLTLLPFFIFYLFVWIVSFPFDRKNAFSHYFTMLWTRLYLTFNPGWKLRVENRDKINRKKACIIISNHQSIIDVALLLQLNMNFRWVSKIELASVPFVGWVIWMNNHILVRRGDKQSITNMAEACQKAISRGIPVFMFPEGTRTGNGQILPFKEGAFILARENDVPILPVVIDGTGDALPRHGFLFKVNQTFTIRVLDEISSETIETMEIPQLMDYTRIKMVDALNDLRNHKS